MNLNEIEDGNPMHMVHMVFHTSKLIQVGRMLNLPLRITSLPYLVHCALSELFGNHAPKPFDIMEASTRELQNNHVDASTLHLLGYASVDMGTLHNTAMLRATPSIYQSCDWASCSSKPMPDMLPLGQKLSFETRVCPVVQKASAGEKWSKGQELDVFLSKVWQLADPSVKVDRESTYSEWLKEQFQRESAAVVHQVSMKRFAIERMSRRTKGEPRKTRVIQRPDATMTGVLEIQDSDAFQKMLRRGIGRHRSFGFGMLKIRPLV